MKAPDHVANSLCQRALDAFELGSCPPALDDDAQLGFGRAAGEHVFQVVEQRLRDPTPRQLEPPGTHPSPE